MESPPSKLHIVERGSLSACTSCGKVVGDPRSGLFNGKCWECSVGRLAYGDGLKVARLHQAALEVVRRHDKGTLSPIAGDSSAIDHLRNALNES